MSQILTYAAVRSMINVCWRTMIIVMINVLLNTALIVCCWLISVSVFHVWKSTIEAIQIFTLLARFLLLDRTRGISIIAKNIRPLFMSLTPENWKVKSHRQSNRSSMNSKYLERYFNVIVKLLFQVGVQWSTVNLKLRDWKTNWWQVTCSHGVICLTAFKKYIDILFHSLRCTMQYVNKLNIINTHSVRIWWSSRFHE